VELRGKPRAESGKVKSPSGSGKSLQSLSFNTTPTKRDFSRVR